MSDEKISGIGLARHKREGAYYDGEGNEITKEEYELAVASRRYSKQIELRYDVGIYDDELEVDRYANEIRRAVSVEDRWEFMAALAHGVLFEGDPRFAPVPVFRNSSS